MDNNVYVVTMFGYTLLESWLFLQYKYIKINGHP